MYESILCTRWFIQRNICKLVTSNTQEIYVNIAGARNAVTILGGTKMSIETPIYWLSKLGYFLICNFLWKLLTILLSIKQTKKVNSSDENNIFYSHWISNNMCDILSEDILD